MDLLPNLEMINIQKIGFRGNIVNKLVRIEDFEKIDWRDMEGNPNLKLEPMLKKLNWTFLDFELIYKDKSTGEIFMFEKEGVWNWEGISHELLY